MISIKPDKQESTMDQRDNHGTDSIKIEYDCMNQTISMSNSNDGYQLKFCSSESSLNTSLNEINIIVDLDNNEYLHNSSSSDSSSNRYNFNKYNMETMLPLSQQLTDTTHGGSIDIIEDKLLTDPSRHDKLMLSLKADRMHYSIQSNALTAQPNGTNEAYEHTCRIKHDVSIGTDLSFTRDLRYKKDQGIVENFRTKKTVDKESFKLVEKIQPKKSRTKYTKEQIEVLEGAYSRNPYPDVIIVEQLCKTLNITRDKVNIWFQNRRARNKRTPKTDDNFEQPSSQYKVYKTYNHQQQQSQQQQQPQLICSISNVSNYNNSYCTQQGFMHQTTPTLLTCQQNQMNYTNTNGFHGTVNASGPWAHQSNYFSSFNNIDCSPNTYCIGTSTSYSAGPNGNYVENN